MSQMVLKVLSDNEIEKLHAETLRVLSEVGVKITHKEALGKFAQAGAAVNETNGLVKMSKELVGELLAQASPEAHITGLNGKEIIIGAGKDRCYGSLILDPYIIDYEAGVRRPVLEDVRRNTIIGESLDRINSMMRMQFPVTDVPEPDSCYKTMEVFLSHTTKNIAVYGTSEENTQDWFDALAVIADAAGLPVDETPLAIVAAAVTSPLQVHGPNVELMKMAMQRCYPIVSTVCPMAGTTSPYSVAGTMLISNIEALLPVLIAQLYKPGHPVFYMIGPSCTNMQSGHDYYYKAEKMLFKAAAAQMGEYYNLPISGEAGGSMTGRADVQNGAESMMYLLASHAAGQNYIGGLGSYYNANGMSSEQIIMQCGLIDMAEYVSRGIDLSDEKLAFDSISNVGPGGNYLTDDLTMQLLRSDEFSQSRHFDYTGGYEDDGPGIYEKAHQQAQDLVANYEPTVPGKVREAIERFFAEKYTCKKM
ncbi:MAG: trimethylamine methyltransferase family protein [Sedimentisphaerales bacterium]|nr:trimethylamine methyltransferase family protein [Sedimentisphaerales bacterium]